jgi:hypothetical protein
MAQRMLEVESECQALFEAFERLLGQVRARAASASADGAAVDYGQIEQQLADATAALEREANAAVLSALDVQAPQVLLDGQAYRPVLRGPGTYYTMAGPVMVQRTLYRKVGDRTGPTVDAISLRAGIVGPGWLPKTAEAMASECQRAPSREAEKATKQWLRLPYSRSAFEQVTHLVGEHYGQRREVVERALVETMEIPEQAYSISVSLDRVSIPMEEPRPPGQPTSKGSEVEPEEAETGTEPAAEPPAGRKKNKPKRSIQRVFRQAYAATVTLHDKKGDSLCTLRYGRMPQGDIDGLCTALCDDVLTLLKRCPTLLVVLLCDGAKELWNRLGAEFATETLGRPVYRLVDLWHLLEKLGAATKLMYAEKEGGSELSKWRLKLLNEHDAVEQILQTLQASGKEQVRVGDSRPVHEAITYLQNHREDMRYAQARRLGLPVGSGNVEATCKSLYEVRLKRPGCRWKQETGAHIVDLRALGLSDRYSEAITLALAPLRRSVSPRSAPSTGLSCAA